MKQQTRKPAGNALAGRGCRNSLAGVMVVLIGLALYSPSPAFAWGETGHRVVCQIAYDELSDAARAEVDRLLALDPMYDTFAESCLFADSPERIRWQEHFINLPRGLAAITTSDCPLAETCVLTAIPKDIAQLSPGLPDTDRLLALKLLGHWVGDIHQPLHVSFQDDRGANNVLVDVADDIARPPSEFEANLHGVWDYMIISHALGDDYAGIAAQLRRGISNRDREQWRFDSPVEWADESFQITIDEQTGYCVYRKGSCRYTAHNRMLSEGESRKTVSIDTDYLDHYAPVVRLRLKQAGVRLASVIEQQWQ